jgi:hypothetical protein
MSRKSTLLALAAIASLGTLALASTDASARGFGGGGMRSGGGIHGGGAFRSVGIRSVGFRGGVSFRRFAHVRPHWHHHWHFGWRRPYWIAPVVAGGVTYAAAPTYNRCTCLTKEYTQEGAVVFKDVCTQEIAMNPPANAAPTQQGDLQPQPMPQQTYAPPQTYAAPQGQPYPQYR